MDQINIQIYLRFQPKVAIVHTEQQKLNNYVNFWTTTEVQDSQKL